MESKSYHKGRATSRREPLRELWRRPGRGGAKWRTKHRSLTKSIKKIGPIEFAAHQIKSKRGSPGYSSRDASLLVDYLKIEFYNTC